MRFAVLLLFLGVAIMIAGPATVTSSIMGQPLFGAVSVAIFLVGCWPFALGLHRLSMERQAALQRKLEKAEDVAKSHTPRTDGDRHKRK